MLSPRLLFAAMILSTGLSAPVDSVSLAGTWRFALDPANNGRDERWFNRALPESIPLPGSVQERRLGNAIRVDTPWTGGIVDKSYFTDPVYEPYRQPGNIKVPFWLQPETHYTGAAWYQRDIEIPAEWQGKQVSLTLERPHWKTTVWLDGREVGSSNANSVAHRYALGTLAPGRHVLTIRVDNTLDPDIGENSHSVADHTQGNWNGVVGRIALQATAPVWIEDVQVETRIERRIAVVRGQLQRSGDQAWPPAVTIAAPGAGRPEIKASVTSDGGFRAEYPFRPDASLWDEFSPALHRIEVALENGERKEITFGFRRIAADGPQLTLNGRKLFLRGALDCAAFPRTGHPPTDVAEWKRILGVIKAHGLNHVRYHSWCPPEAAFVAADELGVYLQVEVASWPNRSTRLGEGKPVDAWIDAETERILRAYGNHPSFVILCACNEPGGAGHASWLAGWTTRQQAKDPRRLYSAGAGWPEIAENDFHIRSEPRIHHWGEGLGSRLNASAPETRTDYTDFIGQRAKPVVAHEIGQWCVYPNFAEMKKYTGYLKPKNFEIFQASLEAKGLGGQAHDFLIASGKLQVLCYKEDIEAALRTPTMGGFQLLGLADFPGQGTALVGVVDPFWEEKGYINAAEFRRFCSPTVPLARLDKRVYTTDEYLVADLEVAHYGAEPLRRVTSSWRLVGDDGRVAAKGDFKPQDLAVGAGNQIGRVNLALANIPAPARYKLVVAIAGTEFANDWDVWVYPPAQQVVMAIPAGIEYASQINARILSKLESGATVWLTIPPALVAPDPKKGRIEFGFSSIFWNTAWTNGQAPHTFGVLCNPKHPAFARFPTDSHSNWQWWYPIKHAAPMILDGLPRELRPVVQVVDDWFTNRKLGLVFEARVGKGKLLVTSITLEDEALDPVRRQLRASLLAYIGSAAFQPSVEVSSEQLRTLFKPR